MSPQTKQLPDQPRGAPRAEARGAPAGSDFKKLRGSRPFLRPPGARYTEDNRRVRGSRPTGGALEVTSFSLLIAGLVAAGDGGEHHILDPRSGCSPKGVASTTVIAPHAMMADALATAAFVLGPEEGLDLLERAGVEGLIVTPDLAEFRTRALGDAA